MATPISRRKFLGLGSTTIAIAGLSSCRFIKAYGPNEHYMMTVRGPLTLDHSGLFLAHEHAITDFSGAEVPPQRRYDRTTALAFLLPYFQSLKALGLSTLAECTPAYIGRDVRLLKLLSEKSGINILTNTGYYAAVNFKYLPAHAHTESSDQLASRWIAEWQYGIDGTDVRPGFIKLGVGNAPLKPLERKLISAASITHLKTGLPIAIHTGDGPAALEEAEMLSNLGVSPTALIWVHAQNDQKGRYHVELASRGVWISLDGFSDNPAILDQYTGFLQRMKQEKLLHQVLIAQDDGFSLISTAENVAFEPYKKGVPYTSVLNVLRPHLQSNGFSAQELTQLLSDNPAKAFRIERRPLKS